MPVSRRAFGKRVHGNRVRKMMLAGEKEEATLVKPVKKPSKKKKGLKKLFSKKVKKDE